MAIKKHLILALFSLAIVLAGTTPQLATRAEVWSLQSGYAALRTAAGSSGRYMGTACCAEGQMILL